MTEQVKNAVIQQLNVSYVADEDRLLLRIGMSNQTELAVWLTYRATRQVAEVLQSTPISVPSDERVNTPYNQALEQQFVKQEMTQKLNFKDEYQERELLNREQVFLVRDCRVVAQDGKFVLDLFCVNQQVVSLALNNTLLLGLSSMLQKACWSAQWHLVVSEQSLLSSGSINLLH